METATARTEGGGARTVKRWLRREEIIGGEFHSQREEKRREEERLANYIP